MSELNYIAAMLHAGDSGALRLVDPERDLSDAWRRVYAWIIAFRRDYGTMPNPLTVGGTWSVQLLRPPESAEYYAAQIQQGVKRAKLEEKLAEDVVPHLEGHDPDSAMTATADALSQIRQEFPSPDDDRSFLSGMDANVDERVADYQVRSQSQGQLGLPLPWQSMTRMTLGLQPGELWALIARPGIGKTWTVIVVAVYLWQLGYRVLFASMETAPRASLPKSRRARERLGAKELIRRQRLTIRFDAIGARISAWRFLLGACNPQEWAQYLQFAQYCRDQRNAPRLDGMPGGWGDLRIVSSPRVRSVGQLEQEASEFDPDVVIWDSAFLAIPHRQKGGSGKRTDLAGYFLEDCKRVAERLDIPLFLTWHFNREAKENDAAASMNDIALTDDMGRLLDVIMYLFRPPEMADAGEGTFRSGKIRDGVGIAELRTRFEIKRECRFDEIAFGPPEQRAQ